MSYAIYLRKSRADTEAEARGEGETLARHERALKDLARRGKYPVTHIYREIVSGESIENRPQMRQLLADVAAHKYKGVLVMEVERLARGDTADQATVANTFRFSNTLIITPVKTYDPNNPMDEEYFEFSLFMSRREYKTITRRMQTGRKLAAKEGKYMGSRAPYGYDRIKRPDGAWTLAVNPAEAPVVRDIFRWYADGVGSYRISERLNSMGICTKYGKRWRDDSIVNIIHNPVYAGHITWDKAIKTLTGIDNGQKQYRRIKSDTPTFVRGLHDPLVSQELFDAANSASRSYAFPVRSDMRITNPLAGLLVCSVCGANMYAMPARIAPSGTRYPTRLTCRTPGCTNFGAALNVVEDIILETLEQWSVEYNEPHEDTPNDNTADITAAEQHINQLRTQRDRLCDFLERGVYDEETYLMRTRALTTQITEAEEALTALKESAVLPHTQQLIRAIAPFCHDAAAAYRIAVSPEDKNRVLRAVIDHIVYTKDKRGNNRNDYRDHIRVDIYPKYLV